MSRGGGLTWRAGGTEVAVATAGVVEGVAGGAEEQAVLRAHTGRVGGAQQAAGQGEGEGRGGRRSSSLAGVAVVLAGHPGPGTLRVQLPRQRHHQ